MINFILYVVLSEKTADTRRDAAWATVFGALASLVVYGVVAFVSLEPAWVAMKEPPVYGALRLIACFVFSVCFICTMAARADERRDAERKKDKKDAQER